MALEAGVLQAIAASKGYGINAHELAAQTSTDELFIIRIMRLVTCVGVCEEVDYATYTANATTMFITQKAFIGAEKHHTDLTFPIGGNVIELMRTNGLHQFPEGDQKSPFEYTFGSKMFDYFNINPEQKDAFDDYMAARRSPNQLQWFEIYPAKDKLANVSNGHTETDAVLLVDVGGGFGHEIVKFRERYPEHAGRLILQDLPITFAKMESPPHGVEMMRHDFFTAQPVKKAKAYYLRNIMHDWSDAKCRIILKHIADAMDKTHSVILIDDYVIPNTGADPRAASMDVLMMLYVSGMERTLHQWEALLESAGLELVKVWSVDTGYESVIEARLKA